MLNSVNYLSGGRQWVGLAGPHGMLATHDMRDWAQRQSECHDYFAHGQVW